MVLLMVVMAAGIFGTTYWRFWAPSSPWTFSGGTQMISPEGQRIIGRTQEQLNQAVEITRQRVDGAGVFEAEVTTSSACNNGRSTRHD